MCATTVAILAGHAAAQTSFPMITHCSPVAVQRGKTAAVTVEGQMTFRGTYKLLIEGAGVTAEFPAPAKPPAANAPVRSVAMNLTVAGDAPLGVREFRLAAAPGVSSLGQLLIVDDPVVSESGDNNTRDKANPVPVPSVVCGRIEAAEDVDYFKIQAKAGQTLTLEVFCARLQDKIHDLQKHADPLLALFDAEGRELAASDDAVFADPRLTFAVPADGDYFVQVRDAKYMGDPRWVYALHVTDRPYVTHVFPLAANPGQVVEVSPVGSAARTHSKLTLTAPSEPGVHEVSFRIAGRPTNPTALVVTPLPIVREQEPNDTPQQAQRVTLPCAVAGRIDKRRDADHFTFKGTKGQSVRLEVKARRFGTPLQSGLDSVLEVLSPAGAVLATNDDAFGKDAALTFAPPADGEYVVLIRDLHNRGGETFVYVLEMEPAHPDFTLRCDPAKAMIGPGSSTAWYVQVNRLNGFAGPVTVELRGLPKGVTVNPLTITAAMTQGLLVLTADANAMTDATAVEVFGTGADGKAELTRRAVAVEEIYLPGGGRGRFDAKLFAVAVTEPTDIKAVRVKPSSVTIKPGEEFRIEVTIERRSDYDKGVTLDVMLRHLGGVFANPLPPGVTIDEAKSKTLLGTGSAGHVVLKAAPDAVPVENVPVSVLANVSVNFVVKIAYSSEPILLTVRK
jgi:hypothetical protein